MRKANFEENEVRLVLEDVAFERPIVFIANTKAVTNTVKNEVW